MAELEDAVNSKFIFCGFESRSAEKISLLRRSLNGKILVCGTNVAGSSPVVYHYFFFLVVKWYNFSLIKKLYRFESGREHFFFLLF